MLCGCALQEYEQSVWFGNACTSKINICISVCIFSILCLCKDDTTENRVGQLLCSMLNKLLEQDQNKIYGLVLSNSVIYSF